MSTTNVLLCQSKYLSTPVPYFQDIFLLVFEISCSLLSDRPVPRPQIIVFLASRIPCSSLPEYPVPSFQTSCRSLPKYLSFPERPFPRFGHVTRERSICRNLNAVIYPSRSDTRVYYQKRQKWLNNWVQQLCISQEASTEACKSSSHCMSLLSFPFGWPTSTKKLAYAE